MKGGKDAKGSTTDEDENEYNLKESYDVPQLDNFNVAAQYGRNTVKVKSSGAETKDTQVRLIITYGLSVL